MGTVTIAEARIEEGARDERAVGEGRDQELFFEVSKKVGSAEMLQGWFEWFRALNIPCAITKSRRGYALWRQGEEVGRNRSKARPELVKQKIVSSFGL